MKKIRKNRSKVWSIDSADLSLAVNNSSTIADVMRKLDLPYAGGTIRAMYGRLEKENIDFSHIPRGRDSNKYRPGVKLGRCTPLDQIMIENSSYARGHLKRRLIKDKVLAEICDECGISPIWNNKPLVFVLDHINGIPNDHRLENLRLLCPNCNSQTDTFSGRNVKRKSAPLAQR